MHHKSLNESGISQEGKEEKKIANAQIKTIPPLFLKVLLLA
jgi:hypothetical protein